MPDRTTASPAKLGRCTPLLEVMPIKPPAPRLLAGGQVLQKRYGARRPNASHRWLQASPLTQGKDVAQAKAAGLKTHLAQRHDGVRRRHRTSGAKQKWVKQNGAAPIGSGPRCCLLHFSSASRVVYNEARDVATSEAWICRPAAGRDRPAVWLCPP
jgi:hypothetical protein